MKLYSVYDKKNDDFPVAVFSTSKECAAAMGIKVESFEWMVASMSKTRFHSDKWEIVIENLEDVWDPVKIANFVKRLRGEESLKSFSEKCGVHCVTMGIIERGFNPRTGKPANPNITTLEKIARACGISVSDFMNL